MNPNEPISVRFACLQEAISLLRNSTEEDSIIIHAADNFYKFVSSGEVPKDEDD